LVNITPNSIILKAFSKFEVYNLNNALIWNTNGSIYSNTNLKNNDGNINFSQGSNNYSYVLDNFNLTESIPRANSPIWINSHDLTKNQNENIHIASNLTDTISNFTVNVNVDDCVNIKSVTLTPNGMSAYTPSYTCDSTTKTLTIIDPIITQSAMSNVISIIYNLPQLNSFCSTIIGGFFGSMSMIFTILGVAILIGILFFVFMAVNGKGTNIDASAMSDLFEKFDIKMVLILVLGIGIFIFLIMTVFGALCS
jgi:uncharacterized integral membrane protein